MQGILKTEETGNILSKIIRFCSKGQATIESTESKHFDMKSELSTWICSASDEILGNIIPKSFWQQYELEMPKQLGSLCCASWNKASSIVYLVMWSCFNEACKVNIIKCLKDAEHRTFVIHRLQIQPTDKEIWVWLSALVLSVQATVRYGLTRVRSKKKKWGSHSALIITEQPLLEACYLSFAVASSFCPTFACYIGTNPNIKGHIDGTRIVKTFMTYLMKMSPDVPFIDPLSRMFHCTNLGQSKIGIDWFVKAYVDHKSKQNVFSTNNQHPMYQLPQIFKLKEIRTLCAQIGKMQKKFLTSKGLGNEHMIHLDLDKESKSALDALGTDGIDKSEVYFFSTCLAVLTRFVYELLQFQNSSKDRLLGRKVLVKYLLAAFEKNKSKSEGRECLRNVLQRLIKGSAPLFSHEFIASVLQGSTVRKDKSTKRLPPFSIPADDVWKSHFPNDCLKISPRSIQRKAAKEEEEEEEEEEKQGKQTKAATLLLNFSRSPIKFDQKAKKGNDVKRAGKQKQLKKSTKRIVMRKKQNPRLQDDLATAVLKRKGIDLIKAFDAARTTKMRAKVTLGTSNATSTAMATATNQEQKDADMQLQKKVRSNGNNADTQLHIENTKKHLVSGKKERKTDAPTKVTKDNINREKAKVKEEGKKRKWQQNDSDSSSNAVHWLPMKKKKEQQLGTRRNKKATSKKLAPVLSNKDKANEGLLRRSPRKSKGKQVKESIL